MTAVEFNHCLISLEDKLERFALSLTSNRDDAKDLLQETYVKALTYIDKYEEFTNMKAWTYTIMKNTFINNYRKSKKENATLDNTNDLYYLNITKESPLMHPDSEYSYKEINKVVNSLDEGFRVPFLLHAEGYKYKEIAEKLELKIGTVKSRIFITRKKLMELLPEYH